MTFLTAKELAEVSFDLFTSSGIRRYAQKSKQAAFNYGLVQRLNREDRSQQLNDMMTRAVNLSKEMEMANERTGAEVELAVILSALTSTQHPDVMYLLDTLGSSKNLPLVWIAALARYLQKEEV